MKHATVISREEDTCLFCGAAVLIVNTEKGRVYRCYQCKGRFLGYTDAEPCKCAKVIMSNYKTKKGEEGTTIHCARHRYTFYVANSERNSDYLRDYMGLMLIQVKAERERMESRK